jgi:lysylphosphatidylglycerol synthetase-like protein (DUF2156 family)
VADATVVVWLIAGVVGIAVALLAIFLVFTLASATFLGAITLGAMASAQGFVGLVAYAAAWVFLFPLMLISSIFVGFWISSGSDPKFQNRTEPTPPRDPVLRYKWANRLPPYDKHDGC